MGGGAVSSGCRGPGWGAPAGGEGSGKSLKVPVPTQASGVELPPSPPPPTQINLRILGSKNARKKIEKAPNPNHILKTKPVKDSNVTD